MKVIQIAALLFLLAGSLPALAAPGDDEAIVKFCGQPLGENRAVSPVNNQLQRDLYYPNDVVMHFQPAEGGWTLASGWVKHFPVTREGMADRFPCVRDALAQSAQQPAPVADPTIAAQTVRPRPEGDTFGIPHLWLILILAATLVLVLFIPSARQRAKKVVLPEPRILKRKPEVVVEAERESARMRRIEQEQAEAGFRR